MKTQFDFLEEILSEDLNFNSEEPNLKNKTVIDIELLYSLIKQAHIRHTEYLRNNCGMLEYENV